MSRVAEMMLIVSLCEALQLDNLLGCYRMRIVGFSGRNKSRLVNERYFTTAEEATNTRAREKNTEERGKKKKLFFNDLVFPISS